MSQLLFLGGGVTGHSVLEDLSWVLAYSKKGWLEPFQGNSSRYMHVQSYLQTGSLRLTGSSNW